MNGGLSREGCEPRGCEWSGATAGMCRGKTRPGRRARAPCHRAARSLAVIEGGPRGGRRHRRPPASTASRSSRACCLADRRPPRPPRRPPRRPLRVRRVASSGCRVLPRHLQQKGHLRYRRARAGESPGRSAGSLGADWGLIGGPIAFRRVWSPIRDLRRSSSPPGGPSAAPVLPPGLPLGRARSSRGLAALAALPTRSRAAAYLSLLGLRLAACPRSQEAASSCPPASSANARRYSAAAHRGLRASTSPQRSTASLHRPSCCAHSAPCSRHACSSAAICFASGSLASASTAHDSSNRHASAYASYAASQSSDWP